MSLHVASTPYHLRTRLHKFMARPQRHRLLHGYPLAAATPRGMFYSDSIAALLAESRWQTLNELPLVAAFNDNRAGHM